MKLKDLGFALVGVFSPATKAVETKPVEKLEKQLEVVRLKKEISDVAMQIAGRQKAQALRQENYKQRGDVLKHNAVIAEEFQRDCNHRKGGNGLKGFLKGNGDSSQYAVQKHRYRNGDIRVTCLRCGKVWMPGDPEYRKAVDFPTHNTTSSDALVVSTSKGIVTEDFAEAFRKWTNATPFKGLAFSPYTASKEGEVFEDAIKEIKAQAEKLEKPIDKPVTFRKEMVSQYFITDSVKRFVDNPRVIVIQNAEPNIS